MKYLFSCFALLLTVCLSAQHLLWSDVKLNEAVDSRNVGPNILPTHYRAVRLDIEKLSQILNRTNPEFSQKKGIILPVPMPDGHVEEMEIWQSSIMEQGLAERYPNIKTYKGKSIHNSLITSRLGFSNIGFHAMLLTPNGSVLIEPLKEDHDQIYIISYAKDAISSNELESSKRSCGTTAIVKDNLQKLVPNLTASAQSRNNEESVDLYLYKAAIACSGEYAQFQGATTKEAALSHIVATLNQANMVYERDLAIRMVLIEETDSLIFLDPATDPYSNGGEVGSSYQENPAAIEKIIPVDQFDIGHVFIAGCGSGVVGIGGGKVCDASKSLGISCQNGGSNAQFAINIVAHEMGHQLYAGHSWNTCPGNEGQHSSGTAYEPGSGSTIMSYAGACGGGNNIQNASDGYYHITNIEEILVDKLIGRTSSCPEIIETSNIKPVAIINYNNGFYIPINTPFELEGDGFDENGDALTYSWEQYNRGPSTNLGEPLGNTPSFRSFPPTDYPVRSFPRKVDIINNRKDKREILPAYNRNLTFRLTVRDNNVEAGGVDWATVSFEATETAGPFLVEFPNAFNDFVEVGDFAEIQWDVANTDGPLVNCQKVNILLSTDGGSTFPITLLENTGNDGKQSVTIPDLPTTQARIRVEAADNIFFDISDLNFDIRPSTKVGFSFATSIQEQQECLPGAPAISLPTFSLGGFDQDITFSGSSLIEDNPDFIATFNFGPTTKPGEENLLTFLFPEDFPAGPFSYEIIGTAPNVDTVRRTITLNLVSNQFTDFALTSPEINSSGIGLPTFEWVITEDANTYEIEIATSPAFGNSIIDAATSLTENTYVPTNSLPESTIYYWRVRPVNDCGAGPNSEIFAFQTQNLSCTAEGATEVPINISALGTPTIESKMTVTQDFIINDLNIPKIKGSHDWVSHIRTTLISPRGTEAILFSGKCPGSVPFNLGFDDESPNAIPCPPIGAALHQPLEPLSIFDGESSFGDWILRITVLDGFGEGGSLDEWSLEFCGNITLDPPMLVTNETLPIRPKTGRLIDGEFLLAEDVNNTAEELIYTLVETPKIGTLLFNREAIQVGRQFTQADLNNGLFKYRHDTQDTVGTDQFLFTVSDGEGGWIGITPFEIVLDESETTVGIEEVLDENLLLVYPNPANDKIQIDYSAISTKSAQIYIYDVQGKLVLQKNIVNSAFNELGINHLDNGLYFIKLALEEGIVTKKLIKQY